MEATTILPALSDFLFCRNVLTPLPPIAVVVGLKADRVAEAGNDVGWVCIWRTLLQKKPSFQQSFFLQPEPQMCVSNGSAPMSKPDTCFRKYQCCSFFYAVLGIVLLVQVIYNTLLK